MSFVLWFTVEERLKEVKKLPTKKSAFKSMRVDRKRHLRNKRTISELRTRARRFRALLVEKKIDEAKDALRILMSKIDKAADKNILHRNTASRKKSRLAKELLKS